MEAAAHRADLTSLKDLVKTRREANGKAFSSPISVDEALRLREDVQLAERESDAGRKQLEEERSSLLKLKSSLVVMAQTAEADKGTIESLWQSVQGAGEKQVGLQKRYDDLKSSCGLQKELLEQKEKELGDALTKRQELGKMFEQFR